MNKIELNELLRDAIVERNIDEVKRLLEIGADPNFHLPIDSYKDSSEYRYQPYSPLRLVVFIISDSQIGEKELIKDAVIAQLLIDNGADAISAMQLAEDRYGKYNANMENSPFVEVIKIIKNSELQQRKSR